MTDFPIIFSAPMILALLDGRKTMTRRLAWYSNKQTGEHFVAHARRTSWQRVKPGDRLWARESLTHITRDPVSDRPCSVHCYTANTQRGFESANPYEPNYLLAGDGEPNLRPTNIQSIHMPRWVSRLTLIVTATRIERLQAIGNDDAIAEGARRFDTIPTSHPYPDSAPRWSMESPVNTDDCLVSPACAFGNYWIKLHGEQSWHTNPEVVCLSFRAVKANIDEMKEAI